MCSHLVVHESMIESRLNNIVPAQLLKMWINQEKDLVRELVALSEIIAPSLQQRLLHLFERHFRRIGDYTQVMRKEAIIISWITNLSIFFVGASIGRRSYWQF